MHFRAISSLLAPVLSLLPLLDALAPQAARAAEPLASASQAGGTRATEEFGVHGQLTMVGQRKQPFSAPYTGASSLTTQREWSRSTTATLFAGMRAWQGGELYFNPEVALGTPLSNLTGLGGFTNGEMARTSGADPTFYRARLFARHTVGLGGGSEYLASDQNQLAGHVDRNRVVVTAGNLSALDVFDDNAYSHEPRRQFMNWSLMTHGAWDFPADARGYTWGAALEWITPEWSVRAGRFLMPRESNGLRMNSRVFANYGDVLELEKPYEIAGRPGRVRLLAFRNVADMGSFRDALNRAPAGVIPELTMARSASSKRGGGISVEQELAAGVGAFLRGSRNDGERETFAFTEIDQSVSGGLVIDGRRWSRAGDEVGIALASNGLSATHREFLRRGGRGFFLGDGALNYATERIVEAYYSAKLLSGFWATLDYQQVRNPGYNADRAGPARVWTLRLHTEF